jgi:hypothetical protein
MIPKVVSTPARLKSNHNSPMSLDDIDFEAAKSALHRVALREMRKRNLCYVLIICLFLAFPLDLKAWWLIVPGGILAIIVILDSMHSKNDCKIIKLFIAAHPDDKLTVFAEFIVNLYG